MQKVFARHCDILNTFFVCNSSHGLVYIWHIFLKAYLTVLFVLLDVVSYKNKTAFCYTQDNDPVINFAPFKGRLLSLDGGTYGGFPIKYLVLVVRPCSLFCCSMPKAGTLE